VGKRAAIILSVALLAQAGVFYGFSRGEAVPAYRPFREFPSQLGPWHLIRQNVLDADVMRILRADDYINSDYAENPMQGANLFVAFFKSQRAGQAPHSPKNCLPGSGWIWTTADTIPVTIPGHATPITINRYVVARGDLRDVVLYWYQSRERVVASEYSAKIFVVADALRYNRTDTALVKVTVPINDKKEQAATDVGVEFIRTFFATLRSYLPS